MLEAPQTNRNGFVAHFDQARAALRRMASELDHRLLNELPAFQGSSPSAEHQGKYFYERMADWVERLLGEAVRAVKVRVIQEPEAWAEYEP